MTLRYCLILCRDAAGFALAWAVIIACIYVFASTFTH